MELINYIIFCLQIKSTRWKTNDHKNNENIKRNQKKNNQLSEKKEISPSIAAVFRSFICMNGEQWCDNLLSFMNVLLLFIFLH